MISIICPLYNSENHLDKLIDSLLEQKGVSETIEIIFIDDGSNDQTLLTLIPKTKLLEKKYSTVKILKQKHKGPGAARNYGIKESSYDYIAFLDSDDRWYETKLQVCIDIIKENKDMYNCYIHDEKYIRKNGESSIIENGITKNESISRSLYLNNCLSTSAVIVKKSLIKKFQYFDENLQSSQDYDLWLKMAPDLKIYKIKDILGEYIESSYSITSKYYIYRFLDQLFIAIRYRHYVSNLQFLKKIIRIILSKQWFFGLIKKNSHNY